MVRDDQSVLNDRVTAVLCYSELLLQGTYGTLNPQQKKALSEVVVAACELRNIIRHSGPVIVED